MDCSCKNLEKYCIIHCECNCESYRNPEYFDNFYGNDVRQYEKQITNELNQLTMGNTQ